MDKEQQRRVDIGDNGTTLYMVESAFWGLASVGQAASLHRFSRTHTTWRGMSRARMGVTGASYTCLSDSA